MVRQIGVMISVGLADSLTPSTIGPALYLATHSSRVWRVMQFTTGFFTVNVVAGGILLIGPGRVLLELVPRPQGTVREAIELVAGIVLMLVAGGLWVGRRHLARRELPASGGGSALIAGASVAAVELLSAAPYFAIIAAIEASHVTVVQQLALLAVYNLVVVLPLLGILVLLLLGHEGADRWLTRAGAWVQRRWPLVLAGLLMFVGGALTLLGARGLVT
jgi:cytochrome c biogenesis protein CcdA